MVEREQQHLHAMQRAQVLQPHQIEVLGMWLGGGVTMVALVGSIVVTLMGYPAYGSGLFGTTALSIVLAYVRRPKATPPAALPTDDRTAQTRKLPHRNRATRPKRAR